MNILKHKSWHVYNKDNIEKVRRDERQAAEDQERKDAKIQLAEQEQRIALLRGQKHTRDQLDNDDNEEEAHGRSTKVSKLERFSLFDQPINTGTNAEYEEDKKKEKEKLERQYTMYLGQDRNGPPKVPWYMMSKEEGDKESNKRNTRVEEEKAKKDQARQKRDDPMLGRLSSSHKAPSESVNNLLNKSLPSSTSTQSSAQFDIQKLREQRLKREASERHKSNVLINAGKMPDEVVKHNQDERYYHSQFNPDFVRKPNYDKSKNRYNSGLEDKSKNRVRFA